jgi:MFS family permease
VAGFGGVGFLSRGNLLVQTAVPDRLRGRVMGLWVLVFIGGMALGGLLLGAASERIGARAAVAASGAACLLLAGAIRRSLPPADEGAPAR